jgi:hypothetical protein
MKTSLKSLVITASALVAWTMPGFAQEMLSREEAMRYAFVAAMHEPSTSQAPIRVDSDLKRPVAGHDGDYGVLILPETKLSAATLQGIQGDVVPVGQLWLRKLTPMADGSAIDESQLQMVRISHEGNATRVPLCLLGVRKSKEGALELVVYSKGKEPLVKVPMTKVTRTQSLPIEFTSERESDSGRVTLRLVGQYEATLFLTELPE